MKHLLSRSIAAVFAGALLSTTALVQTACAAPQDSAAMTMKTTDSTNAIFNDFLKKYVTLEDGITLVRYGDVTDADEAALEGYIDTLSKSGPPSGTDQDIMAYWFNLYNAETINVILDNYPVKSIREIGGSFISKGPWNEKTLTVAGKAMSLNNIEHDTVRAQYDEPRIHYAFNCASIGCPNLKLTAWDAETLDEDLSAAATDFIGSARGVNVDDKGRIVASSIFNWYKGDFGGNDASLLAHLAKYATGDKKAALISASKIRKYDYDWNLNVKR